MNRKLIYNDENFICERITKIIKTHDAQGDLCNISKVNETCNLIIATYDNRLEKNKLTLFYHQIAIISMQILDGDV